MGNFLRHHFSLIKKNRSILLLALCLILAFTLAIILAGVLEESFLLLMRTAVSTRVSIVGLFAVSYLPFLFSAFAVYIRKPKLLLIGLVIKAFMFVFCGLSCIAAFPAGGWLVRILLQFSDYLLFPVLCWFAVRQIIGHGDFRKDFSLCTVLFVIAGSLDYCVVSPFLVMLIDN